MPRKPPEPSGGDGTPSLPGLGPAGEGRGLRAPLPLTAHIESDTSHKFSPSKLNTYRDCPRRYRYRYVDGLRRRVETVETLLGSCVHKALELLYEGLKNGRRLSLDETLALFDREWAQRWSAAVVIRHKEYAPEHYQAAGRDCVRNYYQTFAPFDRGPGGEPVQTLGIEERLGFPLRVDEETVRIEGLVDRLDQKADGSYEIHDYKTTGSLPAQADLDADWQLAIYDIAVRERWRDARQVRLVWHFVRFNKTMVSERGESALEGLKTELAALIRRIKRDLRWAPHRSSLCDWCEYRDICPLWESAEALKSASAARIKADPGVGLAQQYAALDEKRRGLKDKLHELEVLVRQVEDKIVEHFYPGGLPSGETPIDPRSLACPEGEMLVSVKRAWHVPTRSHAPEIYAAIEAELKETPLWKRVSHIDLHKLLDGYERKEWDPDSMRLIEGIVARHGGFQEFQKASLRFHHRAEAEAE